MATKTRGPLGSAARFGLIAASPDDAGALRRLGTYGFIKGATGYIVGAVRKGPGDLEDYGYLLEEVILHATGARPGHLLARRDVHAQHASRPASAASAATRPSRPSSPSGTPATTAPSASASARRARGASRRTSSSSPASSAGRSAASARTATPKRSRPSAWRRRRPTSSPGASCAAATTGTSTCVRTQGLRQGQPVLQGAAHRRPAARGPRHRHVPLRAGRARVGPRPGRWVVEDPGLTLPGPGIEYTATWRAAVTTPRA